MTAPIESPFIPPVTTVGSFLLGPILLQGYPVTAVCDLLHVRPLWARYVATIPFVAPAVVIGPPVAVPPPQLAAPGVRILTARASLDKPAHCLNSVAFMPISHPCRLSHTSCKAFSCHSRQLFGTLWSLSTLPLTSLTQTNYDTFFTNLTQALGSDG